MATATAARPGVRYDGLERVIPRNWILNATDTIGNWVEVGACTDASLHLYNSAAWNGATVKLWGSNEEAPADGNVDNAVVCEDLQGNAMSFTANALEGLGVVPRWVCVQVTAGALADDLHCNLFARKQNRG